jgi:hypothetical protein
MRLRRFVFALALTATVAVAVAAMLVRGNESETAPLSEAPDLEEVGADGARSGFTLPPDPDPPAIGTAERRTYFDALVAGDERSLETVRSALANAAAGNGRTEEAYVRRLQEMERVYQERLARHRGQMASATGATAAAAP